MTISAPALCDLLREGKTLHYHVDNGVPADARIEDVFFDYRTGELRVVLDKPVDGAPLLRYLP